MQRFSSQNSRKRFTLNRYFAYIRSLTPSDALVLQIALFVCGIFLVLFLIQLSTGKAVSIPGTGGSLSEGVVGTPRFINPVLAVTRADKDLTALMYDGLMRLSAEGTLVPNVAESITPSEDGLTYNVILRKDVTFHDGAPLTAKDVAFTVLKIQDPTLTSPLRANFDGVEVEVIGDYELNFVLREAYAPFIENLTFGILPEHIWKDAGTEEFPFSQYNSEPVGSGPYMIDTILRNTSGIPELYTLKPNEQYHGGASKIASLALRFYPTEEAVVSAFVKGEVTSVAGLDAKHIAKLNLNEKTHHIERIPLPRTIALFINQNKSAALRDPAARKALSVAIDRKALVEQVLGGYGSPITSPIPPGFGITLHSSSTPEEASIDRARDILRDGGWKLNTDTQVWEKTIDGSITTLSFSIATVNSSAFEATAVFLEDTWKKLGVEVSIKQFEQSDLTQAVIRPRDYEILLFGTQLGRSLDYYSFWHSSQRNDPGLNVSLYTNLTTDSILTELRRSSALEARDAAINRFAAEIEEENPAFFLYAPQLLYVIPNNIRGASFTGVSERNERFSTIGSWYIETESVWPFFTKHN